MAEFDDWFKVMQKEGQQQVAYMQAVHNALAIDPQTTEVRAILDAGKAAMATEIRASIEMLGSCGRISL